MLRWINNSLEYKSLENYSFTIKIFSDKYHMIIYLSTQINSNTKVYGGNLLR